MKHLPKILEAAFILAIIGGFLRVCALPVDGQTVKEEVVRARPVEAEFMQIVSHCVDQSIWQDNQDHRTRTPGDGGADESTLGTYIMKMRVCLNNYEMMQVLEPEIPEVEK